MSSNLENVGIDNKTISFKDGAKDSFPISNSCHNWAYLKVDPEQWWNEFILTIFIYTD